MGAFGPSTQLLCNFFRDAVACSQLCCGMDFESILDRCWEGEGGTPLARGSNIELGALFWSHLGGLGGFWLRSMTWERLGLLLGDFRCQDVPNLSAPWPF